MHLIAQTFFNDFGFCLATSPKLSSFAVMFFGFLVFCVIIGMFFRLVPFLGQQVINLVISALSLGGRSKKQYLMGGVLVPFLFSPCFQLWVQQIFILAHSIGWLSLYYCLPLVTKKKFTSSGKETFFQKRRLPWNPANNGTKPRKVNPIQSLTTRFLSASGHQFLGRLRYTIVSLWSLLCLTLPYPFCVSLS